MTEYLKIHKWDRWQSYRSDRKQPPWIKLHRCLLRNPEWVELTDAQRGQLVAIWLLAADKGGTIPASPAVIQKLCYMTKPPNLQLFIDKGFIDGDVNTTSTRRQHDVNTTHQTRLEETRLDKTRQDKAACAAEFENEFWPNSPVKTDKKQAREQYLIARKIVSKEIILAGLPAYRSKEERRAKDVGYKAHSPFRWLRDERWSDELPTVEGLRCRMCKGPADGEGKDDSGQVYGWCRKCQPSRWEAKQQ